jgi:hypothetical protein
MGICRPFHTNHCTLALVSDIMAVSPIGHCADARAQVVIAERYSLLDLMQVSLLLQGSSCLLGSGQVYE